ncbi:alkaline phosphatase family protein [Brachybacterium sp. UMB0905]|uniref:alkaline phosphatase family protein n=1 Tax=Brachybacterium sp. UMB0905 TaxID=2069310 RepID=UPI000C808CB8|nr:alkaline phosphatase family protein [Brachybacterium sp. UMB0905]PMC74531.1 hypothetical protein CJ197_13110 [Brachybacterium sp. UMB0905]
MKLLLIGLDGVRIDLALPAVMDRVPGFAEPDHPADPRFAAEPVPAAQSPSAPAAEPAVDADPAAEPPSDPVAEPATAPTAPADPLAPTLARLVDGGAILPVWMTPPTDSGPGWASLLTGTTHEQNNVWWNEFVGHRLARTPDLLSQVFFGDPAARTFAASTWDALVSATSAGPVIHQRVDQQIGGQHQLFAATDFSRGCRSADQQVRTRAAWTLNHEGPDAAFVYFEGVDEAGHAHGSTGEEYRQAIRDVDEHTRYLVKAVSERYEQLGEEWLIAVVTDHGHKDEGGHGEDEVQVRRSFLALHAVGPDGAAERLRKQVADRSVLRSEHVTPLLLELIGVRPGTWQAGHEVGQLRDVPSVGPTRDLRYEW